MHEKSLHVVFIAAGAAFGVGFGAMFGVGNAVERAHGDDANQIVIESSASFNENEAGLASAAEALQKLELAYSAPSEEPYVTAVSYLIIDVGTGQVLAEKSPDEVRPIASISKLFTALTSLDTIDQEAEVLVTENASAAYGNSGDIYIGEKYKAGDLIFPMLLTSSNDAAEAIAEYVGRSVFLKTMNQHVAELGLKHTNFNDPSGISPSNTSTARDLAKFLRMLALEKNQLLEVAQKKLASARDADGQYHEWNNVGEFINDDFYKGGKSGYTNDARGTYALIASVPFSGKSRDVVITLLGSEDRNSDVRALVAWASNIQARN